MADEEALRKIRSVEEQIDILNKKLSIAKQVCDLIFFFFLTHKQKPPFHSPNTLSPPCCLCRRRTHC